MIRTVIFSIWLPILVIALTIVRFGFENVLDNPDWMQFLWLFALAWPAAIPLTFAVRLLHRRSRILAYLCALGLGIVLIFTATFGGLLGPVGVIGFTTLASLPAWLLLWILKMAQQNRDQRPHLR